MNTSNLARCDAECAPQSANPPSRLPARVRSDARWGISSPTVSRPRCRQVRMIQPRDQGLRLFRVS